MDPSSLCPSTCGLHRLVLPALLLVTLWVMPTAYAEVITVSSTDDVVADDGVCTLREAITSANTDQASGTEVGECQAGEPDAIATDTIVLAAGTYTLTIVGADEDSNGSGDLDIDGDLTIAGADRATTTIDGGSGGGGGGGGRPGAARGERHGLLERPHGHGGPDAKWPSRWG